jgi:hypothetical protein
MQTTTPPSGVAERPDKPDKNDLTVRVFAPRFPEPRTFTWPKTEKTGDAAREAANAFGYTGGNPALQNASKEVLDNKKPLVANGVRDGDTLELVDSGGGV